MVSVKVSVISETSVDSNSTVNGDRKVDKEAVTKILRSNLWLTSKWRRIVETVVLSFVILVVWGLFVLIPAVLYALPPKVRVLISRTYMPACGTACIYV